MQPAIRSLQEDFHAPQPAVRALQKDFRALQARFRALQKDFRALQARFRALQEDCRPLQRASLPKGSRCQRHLALLLSAYADTDFEVYAGSIRC